MPAARHKPTTVVSMSRLEDSFDAAFASRQALREKQIQQNYRPVIGIHKWFARRPGTLFRALLLAEYGEGEGSEAFWRGHSFSGTIADPFMGGGTTLYEASRLGFSVIGNDINPMSHWLIERAFDRIDLDELGKKAEHVANTVSRRLGHLNRTECTGCGRPAEVKYFLWVKTAECPKCHSSVDAFPGRLLAEAERHPLHVVACGKCGELNEFAVVPRVSNPAPCRACHAPVSVEGNAKKSKVSCTHCQHSFAFPTDSSSPPAHRMWAIEYWCSHCYGDLKGRQFKKPTQSDHNTYAQGCSLLKLADVQALIPDDLIPEGDETARLHRWGYTRYREMFNPRQLLILATLAQELKSLEDVGIRHALMTVLSDILRYNNMLCRYDTYALKCQDIFSVHGFPVGLVQCENNVLGIPGVGSGGFRHFVEKYLRAKRYCEEPFETRVTGSKKEVVLPAGEFIGADASRGKSVAIHCGPSQDVQLAANSLDGIFTDPPYFANVQYSELIDFCYVWLRRLVGTGSACFGELSTRSSHEASGNATAGRGVEEFTGALSAIYRRFCGALKPGAPLVFTYHHNDPLAYVPLVVAVLDAGMTCTAVLPAAAEMSASMHIANTGSSILDSVFVCRTAPSSDACLPFQAPIRLLVEGLARDAEAMRAAGLNVSRGDLRCLLAGRSAAAAMNRLVHGWDGDLPLPARMLAAESAVRLVISEVDFDQVVDATLERGAARSTAGGPSL